MTHIVTQTHLVGECILMYVCADDDIYGKREGRMPINLYIYI